MISGGRTSQKTMSWKKYIKIAAGLLIIISIIWIIYLFVRKTETFQNITTAIFGNEEPIIAVTLDQELTKITEERIFDYWINKKDNSIYYIDETGSVSKISQNNSPEIINSQNLNKLNKIWVSYDGDKIAARFNYPNLPTFSIFDIAAKNWQPLPSNTIAVAWSPIADKLAYLDDKMLNILDFNSQKTQKILNLTQKEVNLDWISESTILLSTIGSIDNPASLWSINLKTKNVTPLINDEQGLALKWANDGSMGIKLHTIKRAPYTSAIDPNGITLAAFSFITMPSKCLIEKEKIYCAIPDNINAGVKLPDDYYKKSVYFNDVFYLIETKNDSAKIIFNPETTSVDADHLELFNNTLLFKNRIDDGLYSLQLNP